MTTETQQHAELIADILIHLYGDSAERFLFGPESYSLAQRIDLWICERYAKNPEFEAKVKRDERGRFATKQVDSSGIRAAITEALKGKRTQESAREMADMLMGMTVKDLTALKKEYGISASGRGKREFVDKIADRLDRGRRIEEPENEDGTNGRQPESGGLSSGGSDTSVRGGGRIHTDREEFTKTPTAEELAAIPENLREHLTDAQQTGAALAISSIDKHGGFLLADGTGVGKTRQILAIAAKYAAEGKKVVVVAPAEVISPDWKKNKAAGSYGKDSEAMGVETSLQKGDSTLQNGKIALTTYGELGKLKDRVDANTVVIFDESHALKNSSSQRGKHGRDVSFNAGAVMYATATPADKPLHIAHLLRAGVFGGKSDSAKKFFGKSEDTYRELGLMKKTFYNRYAGKEISTWQVDPRVGADEVMRRVGGLFDQMTKEGLMVQRSLSMDNVTAISETVPMPEAASKAIRDRYEEVIRDTDGNKAVALMAMRRTQEPFKIASAVNHVQSELAAGRQPIVFLGRVNDSDDDSDDDKPSIDENTAKLLKDALLSAGISEADIGEMHGAATPTSAKKQSAMKKFNDGKTKVLISTLQSGGTGVNLDDTTGDRPRSIIMMTPPLTANDMVQAAGRINRMSTKSNARIINLVSDHKIDQWNMDLLNRKMATLGAVSGKPLEQLMGQENTEQQSRFEWPRKLTESQSRPSTATATGGQSATKTGATVAAKTGSTSATFAKLRDGSWGLRVVGPVSAGDTVTVKKKDGSSQQKKVRSVVKEFNDATLVSFYGMQPTEIEVEQYQLDDSAERASAIADILQHVYGDRAEELIAEQYSLTDRVNGWLRDRYAIGWDESAHPRDQAGRFSGRRAGTGGQFIGKDGKPSPVSPHYDPEKVATSISRKRSQLLSDEQIATAGQQQSTITDEEIEAEAKRQASEAGPTRVVIGLQSKVAKAETTLQSLAQVFAAKREKVESKFNTKKQALESKLADLQNQVAAEEQSAFEADAELWANFNKIPTEYDPSFGYPANVARKFADTADDDIEDIYSDWLDAEQEKVEAKAESTMERSDARLATLHDKIGDVEDQIEITAGDLAEAIDEIDSDLETAEDDLLGTIDELQQEIDIQNMRQVESIIEKLMDERDNADDDEGADKLFAEREDAENAITDKEISDQNELEQISDLRAFENKDLQQQFREEKRRRDWKDLDWQEDEAKFLQAVRKIMAARMKEDRELTQSHSQYSLTSRINDWIVERYWREADHPRNERGQFAKKSDEQIAAIKSDIAKALKSPPTKQGAQKLAASLQQLTLGELKDLKKEYGISAAGSRKDSLVQKIADRLDRGRRADQSPKPKTGKPNPDSLFSEHKGLVKSIVKKHSGRNDFDDLEQVANIALWNAAKTYDPDGGTKFSTWAYRGIEQAVRNAKRGEIRATSKAGSFGQNEDGGDASGEVVDTRETGGTLEREEELQSLQSAMETLTRQNPDAASMVMLKYGGKTYQEIGDQFGISLQAAKQRTDRAVKTLAKLMGVEQMQLIAQKERYAAEQSLSADRILEMLAEGFRVFQKMAERQSGGMQQPPVADVPADRIPVPQWNLNYAAATRMDPARQTADGAMAMDRFSLDQLTEKHLRDIMVSRDFYRWVTLNAEDGEGTRVFIGDDGSVKAGPKGMQGKTLKGEKPKKSPEPKRKQPEDDDDPFGRSTEYNEETDTPESGYQSQSWQVKRAVQSVADQYDVYPDDVFLHAQEKLAQEQEHWESETQLLKHARQSLGINAKTTADMENARSKRGEDFSNMAGLDEFVTEAQDLYPGFNWGDNPTQSLMDAIHKGAKPKPKLTDKPILESAARYLSQTGQSASAVPFSLDAWGTPRSRYSGQVDFGRLMLQEMRRLNTRHNILR